MQLFRRTNQTVLLAATFTVLALTILSFFFMWAKDEGTLGEGVLRNLVADSFVVFQFPVSLIFERINMSSNFYPLLLFGFILNSLFYGWLIERIFFLLKSR